MTLEQRRKRALYRSGHRGMKECDLLLESFARNALPRMDSTDLDWFEQLLEQNDRDILSWVSDNAKPPRKLAGTWFDAFLRSSKP